MATDPLREPIGLNIFQDQPIELQIVDDGTIALGVGVEIMDRDTPEYHGQYVVIPLADEEQTLETKGYKMIDDVTVKKVPYFETSNINGTTVYIASEVG